MGPSFNKKPIFKNDLLGLLCLNSRKMDPPRKTTQKCWARNQNKKQCLLGNNQNKVFVMLPKRRMYQTKCSENLLYFPKTGLVKSFQWVILGSIVQDLKSASRFEKHVSNQYFPNFLDHDTHLKIFVKIKIFKSLTHKIPYLIKW